MFSNVKLPAMACHFWFKCLLTKRRESSLKRQSPFLQHNSPPTMRIDNALPMLSFFSTAQCVQRCHGPMWHRKTSGAKLAAFGKRQMNRLAKFIDNKRVSSAKYGNNSTQEKPPTHESAGIQSNQQKPPNPSVSVSYSMVAMNHPPPSIIRYSFHVLTTVQRAFKCDIFSYPF